MATRNGLDPDEHKIHSNHHYANDPEDLRIVGAVVAEDDGVDDPTEVTHSTDNTRENTLMRVSIAQENECVNDLPLA